MGLLRVGRLGGSRFNGGRSQVNLGAIQAIAEFPFINLFKATQHWDWKDSNTAVALTPDLFDDDGYPVSSAMFTARTGVTTGNMFIPTATEYPGNLVLAWDGNGTVTVGIAQGGGSMTTYAPGTGPTTTVNSTGNVTSTGGAGRYEFTLATATALNVAITSTSAAPNNVRNIRIYNVNDEADLASGKVFGKQFLLRLRQANFGAIRFLGWQDGNTTNVTKWENARRPTTYWSYHTSQFRKDYLCNHAGSGITTNSGVDYTVSAPSNWSTSGGLPADKSLVHAVFNATVPASNHVATIGGAGSADIGLAGTNPLAVDNQVYFTTEAGALPSQLTASTFNTFPQTYYYVVFVSGGTIRVSATQGGSPITFASSATCTCRPNVRINIGGTALIQIRDESFGNLTSGSIPLGGSVNSLATLAYDALMNAWGKQGGRAAAGGVDNYIPVELGISLCAEVGAHPWFMSPPLVCTPMSDWHTQLATLCRDTAPPWMVPIYEGPNELWNTAGGFYQTLYAQQVSTAYGWGNEFHNWYGKVASTIGQAVASVYSVTQPNVVSQSKYKMVCAVQTGLGASSSPAGVTAYDARLTAVKYTTNVGGLQSPPQSGYALDAASQWVTHVCCANYITPSFYGRNQEVRLAFDYYVTNSGNSTAQAANAASYEASLSDGFNCTFTNGTPGLVNATGNTLFAGQHVTFFTTGTLPTGITAQGNYWVLAAGNSFTLSSTDPNLGSSTAVNISGSATGTSVCSPNSGLFTVQTENVRAQNIAAWGAGKGINKMLYYEGGYSPDFSFNDVSAAVTAATNEVQCVLTLPSTNNQSIRNPTTQQNQTNPAAAAGMYFRLTGLTGSFLGFNNQVVQVVSVDPSDGRKVRINLDTSGVGAFSGGGTATFYCDSGAATSMAIALNYLRQAGKNAPNLQTDTQASYTALTAISGAEFPSAFIMAARGVPGTANQGGVWSVLDPDVFVSPDPPQWNAIKAFNA